MNPYLEQKALWRGFQLQLLCGLQAAITPQIVPRHFVEFEERAEVLPEDIKVSPGVEFKARNLVIQDTQTQEIITVIELLTPSKKEPGVSRDRYFERRKEILTTRTNFIEIDLLRGGRAASNSHAP